MVWIESYGNPSGIIAYNDDYQGNGDFDWGRWARINKKYSVAGNAVLLSHTALISQKFFAMFT